MLGVVDHLTRRPPGGQLVDGGPVLLLGPLALPGSGLAGSRWAWERGAKGGALAPVATAEHLALAEVVRRVVLDGLAGGVHDVADGGIALALAELAAQSGIGVAVAGLGGWSAWFGEAPSQVLVAAAEADAVAILRHCRDAGVPCRSLGAAGGDRLRIEGAIDLPVAALVRAWARRLPDAFEVSATH
jgi:phosphoribosylformylglycinamidine synthase